MNASETAKLRLFTVTAIVVWLAAVVLGSASGWLGSLSPFAPPLIASLTILLPSLGYFVVPSLREYITGMGLRRLTAIHISRIVAAPLFFWYGSHHLLPQQFVNAAGWGDLAAGLLALTVVAFWAKPAGYWTAHILGMLDFITAFATAIRLTLAHPGSMHDITALPMSLIPFFGVGLLATTHVVAYDMLLRNRSSAVTGKLRLHASEAR